MLLIAFPYHSSQQQVSFGESRGSTSSTGISLTVEFMKSIHGWILLLFLGWGFVCLELAAGTEHTQLCSSRESRGGRVMLKQPSRLLYAQADCDGGVCAVVDFSYM